MGRFKRARWMAVGVVTAIVVGAGALAIGWHLREGHGQRDDLISQQLEKLRDRNGLFFRPGLLTESSPSIPESAYGFGLLAAGGQHPASPWHSAAANRLAGQSADESSVWGPWYVVQIEAATGSLLPGDWYGRMLASLRPEGFFHDSSQPATDEAADLATTSAALQVVTAKRMPMQAAQIDSVDHWLQAAAGNAANAYQACNAASGLHSIGRLDARTGDALAGRWLRPNGDLPANLSSFEDVLDTYGVACLAALLPGHAADLPAIQEVLRPALSRAVDDTQLLYYVATAWRLAGGDPAALRQLSTSVTKRLDSATALVRMAPTPVGTLENSYYVVEIRKLQGLSMSDRRLADGVHTSMREFASQYGPDDLLMAAVVLNGSGYADPAVQAQAVPAIRAQLSAPVTRENVASWAFGHRLLDDLGVDTPLSELRPWSVSSQEDRDAAWALLGQVRWLNSNGDPLPAFADVVRDLPDVLRSQTDKLTVTEIRMGVEALAALDQADRVPTAAISAALKGAQGCSGLPDLYRPARPGAECDLKASADAVWLRTFLNKKAGGK